MTELAAGPAPKLVEPVQRAVENQSPSEWMRDHAPRCPRCSRHYLVLQVPPAGAKLPIEDFLSCHGCGYWIALVNGIRTEAGKR